MRKKFLKASALIAGLIAMGGVVMGGCKSSGKGKVGAKDKIEQPAQGAEGRVTEGKKAETGDSDSEIKTAAELKSLIDSIELPQLPGGNELLKISYTGGGQGELFAGG